MPVDWKASESLSRLLTAVVASIECQKLDLRRIAALYGDGATYDAIENRFRIVKREAAALREQVDQDGPAAVAKPLRIGGSVSVVNGRVTMSTPTTGKRNGVKVKKEDINEDGISSPSYEDSPTPIGLKKEKVKHTYTFDTEAGTFDVVNSREETGSPDEEESV